MIKKSTINKSNQIKSSNHDQINNIYVLELKQHRMVHICCTDLPSWNPASKWDSHRCNDRCKTPKNDTRKQRTEAHQEVVAKEVRTKEEAVHLKCSN